jgi:hypothetical protein
LRHLLCADCHIWLLAVSVAVEDFGSGPKDGSRKEQTPDFFTSGAERIVVEMVIVTGSAEAVLNSGSVMDLFTRLAVWRKIDVCLACRFRRQSSLGLPVVV